MAPTHLRIFLSSPGDVSAERRLARKIVERLPNEPFPRGRLTMQVIAWDDERAPTPMHANETPQHSVSRYAGLPSNCDLTVVILWSRLGTPLPAEEQRRDGTRYESGTVWEYEDALNAGKPVWVYHRTEKPRVELDDPEFEARAAQYTAVKKFVRTFQNEDGSLKAGINPYASPEELESLLHKHLEAWVRLALEPPDAAPADPQPPARRAAEIDLYRREFVQRNRRLDLDALMPADRGEMVRIALPSIFVEPCVRQDAPPLDIARDDLARLRDAGEVAADEELTSLSPEEVQRVSDVYYEQHATTVFDILGTTTNEHVVLLGDPGSGKSTLARYVVLALLDPDGDIRVRAAYRHVLPILIELRSYVAVRRPAGDCGTIFEFLDHLHRTDGYHPSAGAVQAEIDDGAEVLFIFDGLDEIFDLTAREAVTTEIARLALVPNVRTLATSRPIGYRRRLLTNSGFAHYTIQDLTAAQVRLFLERWFQTVMRYEPADANYRLTRILSELDASQSLRVLAGNPLLLTILAIIGKSRDLPRDRWMLYDNASAVLIKHWDVNRQLKDESIAPYIHPDDKSELLRRLAAKMQGGTSGLAGNYILKDELQRDFETYVKERYEVPRADAAVVARTIISRLHDRNFILAPRGAGLFGFVHRAFLEFFCASWFKDQFEVRQELPLDRLYSEVFEAHASDPAWHEVLRLLAGAIDARFTAKIVDRLIDGAEERSDPWRLAVSLLAFAELRRPALFAAQGRNLLLRVCGVFDADTQHPPRLFRFLKRHVVPPVISIGSQWPDRQVLAGVLREPRPCQFMYVYDHLFGTLVGAIGAGDPQVHQAVVECAQDEVEGSWRVIAPFALAKGWPGESSLAMLLKLARADRDPTVRYAAIYALGEHYADRRDVRLLVHDKVLSGEHVFDRAPASTAYARMHPQDAEALRLLEARLALEQDKYPRTVIVKAMVQCFAELPETREILTRIALRDPSPGPDDLEAAESWYPRQGALHGLVQQWPKAAGTLAVPRDRAEHDPTPWLRQWARLTLSRVAGSDEASVDMPNVWCDY